jgi:hypothetical protein
MNVTDAIGPRWLLLVFSLPTKRASQRVEIWRKLQRFGMLPLRSSGYVLPNSPVNQERMEWLATAIRSYKGQASVAQVQAFDDLRAEKLEELFLEARAREYKKLMHEAKKMLASAPSQIGAGRVKSLRRRFAELQEIDFFESPLRSRVESLLDRLSRRESRPAYGRKQKASEYANRVWLTRPRPGIDRVSSAWLIRRFIDPKAKFAFGSDPASHAGAVPFDMFCVEGFGHRGQDCTFETLCKEFAIRDSRVKRVAEIVHDADLGDEKFASSEGRGLDKVLEGWAKQDLPDDELLKRGIEMIEGLFESLA